MDTKLIIKKPTIAATTKHPHPFASVIEECPVHPWYTDAVMRKGTLTPT